MISELLAAEPIRSQRELLRRLEERGFRVAQSSISRDIRALRVAKVDGRYVPSRAAERSEPTTSPWVEIEPFIRRIQPAGPHLLVVQTTPGSAPAVGLAIDQAGWPEVVGTVAGDDTLFLATAGKRAQARARARFRDLVPEPGRGETS